MLAKSTVAFSLLIGVVSVTAGPLKNLHRQNGKPSSTGGGTGLGDIIAQFPNPPVHVPSPVTTQTTTTVGRRDLSPTPNKVASDPKATPHLEGSKSARELLEDLD